MTEKVLLSELRQDCVYQLYYMGQKRPMAVFSHLTREGIPMFFPPGKTEPMDLFGLDNYDTHWECVYERDGNPHDLGH